jgi:S-DNA-T family DNA segregation ATPase FtsK/SpoIIIE
VHFILGARRWVDLRPSILASCGIRLELRLNDPSESYVGRSAAQLLTSPGRALLPDGHQVQIALPAGLPVYERAHRVAAEHRILPLPRRVSSPLKTGDGAFLLGVTGPRLRDVHLDLAHPGTQLLVSGGPVSGRSTILRRIVRHLVSADLDVLVIDPRRSLKVDRSTLLSGGVSGRRYVSNPADIAGEIRALTTRAERALGQLDSADEDHQTNDRRHPRRQFVIIDDVGVLDRSAGLPGCTAEFARLLPWSEQLGMQVILASAAGIGRGGFDPLTSALRDLGATEVALSAESDSLHRRSVKPKPPGRAQLLVTGKAPITVQCFIDDDGDTDRDSESLSYVA